MQVRVDFSKVIMFFKPAGYFCNKLELILNTEAKILTRRKCVHK